jgi:predicted AlkP superfamily pyrophosphatase or phosphodiesterase
MGEACRRFVGTILACWLLLFATVGVALGGERPAIVLLVVDGLDARFVTPALTPTIWRLGHGGQARSVFYPRALAVMPSVTNANHASLVTGAYPEAHGIVGNRDWERGSASPRRTLDRAELLETDTIFAALPRTSAGIFGKWKLVDLFREDRRLRLWGDLEGELALPHPRTGHDSDERTTTEVLRTLATEEPEFLFANLGDVDRTAHVYGPQSVQARKAILEADRQVARIVGALEDSGRWTRTILVVTADHGFSDVAPALERPSPTLSFGRELRRAGIDGALAVANGRLGSVYLTATDPSRMPNAEEQALLERIRELALSQPEVSEALYRTPNPIDGGDEHTIRARHPDWKLAHPRIGELVLIAKPGHHFNDPVGTGTARMRGTHGGPEDRAIPLLWVGGTDRLPRSRIEGDAFPSAADVGMTIRRLLGLAAPADRQGRPVPEPLRGRPLDALIPAD